MGAGALRARSHGASCRSRRTILPEVEGDVAETVAGAERDLGAVEGKVAEVVEADGQVAVLAAQGERGI